MRQGQGERELKYDIFILYEISQRHSLVWSDFVSIATRAGQLCLFERLTAMARFHHRLPVDALNSWFTSELLPTSVPPSIKSHYSTHSDARSTINPDHHITYYYMACSRYIDTPRAVLTIPKTTFGLSDDSFFTEV
ncbi:hypothetical protein I7I50_05416 [Histoplasma capsulatum G186AR]|uniref:Uncharacterized protein n=1 Tax=Ajellomyces capsulatus TaxID=5037 RepID=A0A8H8D7R0_AJECA|nr:hypothetical protein I7I52_03677 [Histoplasma capsulatum]QSS76080.1 hypothetical protein I7I50_05416 [Histoplasma capsulatum G186AR]